MCLVSSLSRDRLETEFWFLHGEGLLPHTQLIYKELKPRRKGVTINPF